MKLSKRTREEVLLGNGYSREDMERCEVNRVVRRHSPTMMINLNTSGNSSNNCGSGGGDLFMEYEPYHIQYQHEEPNNGRRAAAMSV